MFASGCLMLVVSLRDESGQVSDDPKNPCFLSPDPAPFSCGSRDVRAPWGWGSVSITPGPAAWASGTLVSMATVAQQGSTRCCNPVLRGDILE